MFGCEIAKHCVVYQCVRFVAHNGEINTLKGNVNLMHAREGVMSSSVFSDDLHKLYPIIEPGMSDSGCFDNVVEFLCHAGQRELPEVRLLLLLLLLFFLFFYFFLKV